MTAKIRHIIPLLLSALFIATALASCGPSREEREQVTAASEMGRTRALELSTDAVGNDSIKMATTLLDIRERETRLRAKGYDKAADAYISSFLATLDSVNPSLSASIR